MALKRSAHDIRAIEAAGRGDLLEASRGAFQLAPNGLESHLFHVEGRRFSYLPGKDALEVAFAHCDACSQRWSRKVALEVLDDPHLEVAQGMVVGALLPERNAELRLISRPAKENDQHAGDFQRDLASVVLLDQREAKIDAGGHPCRTVDIFVTYPNGIPIDGTAGNRDENSFTKAQ